MRDSCVKRPAEPSLCRLGCGEEFGGTVGALIESEEERFMHETEECIYRQVGIYISVYVYVYIYTLLHEYVC
jgi:hypothetical protein